MQASSRAEDFCGKAEARSGLKRDERANVGDVIPKTGIYYLMCTPLII